MGSLVACSQADLHAGLHAPGVERSLEERLAAGEEAAFEEMLRRYQQEVAGLAAKLLGYRAAGDAHDVAQEVFVRVYLKRRSFRGDSSIRTWLMRVTVNCVRSLQRRRMLRLDLVWRAKSQEEHAADHGAELSEEGRRARDAVAQLRGRDREAVVLHYLEEMPVSVVAEVMGTSQGAVMTRLHRARKKLSQLLGGSSDE
jgi:RNA polymerase sigma-70 factor (ECF subfamily)